MRRGPATSSKIKNQSDFRLDNDGMSMLEHGEKQQTGFYINLISKILNSNNF